MRLVGDCVKGSGRLGGGRHFACSTASSLSPPLHLPSHLASLHSLPYSLHKIPKSQTPLKAVAGKRWTWLVKLSKPSVGEYDFAGMFIKGQYQAGTKKGSKSSHLSSKQRLCQHPLKISN